ncbi:PREDICTED: mitochondrial import inner membrane translocase subunit TIM44-2-like isoform X2 [Ipomoea nil]|uniref:mitochondrial import inner membrane translocase subunit TIM44-2-like isoform X2 n=1 Tax=Ipomoea nil TaxID=35883 RepID=UPI000901CA64|nr:PREDICTED: mitochondrial import inner membrane translocase subunit TIM44-2-like isoform X2 [Ipomoea nil]
MASRKLVRDFLLSKRQPVFHQLLVPQQVISSRGATSLRLGQAYGYVGNRQFSVFNEFSQKLKGEVNRNKEFQQSVKELKDKAEELQGVKEDLKARTKQTTEQLYKHVDGVWTEAESTAKKVYANVGEKVSAAKEEVKETFGYGKQDSEGSNVNSDSCSSNTKDTNHSTSGEKQQQHQKPDFHGTAETVFGKVKSAASSISSKVLPSIQKLKEAKPIDLAKKGYAIVVDELKGTASKRKHLETPSESPQANIQRSTRTDIVVLPSKESRWSKKWEAFKEKMQGNPLFKRVRGASEPVVTKSQEIAEDIRERWETSDHPVVICCVNLKWISSRTFSLPDFVSEVQEVIRPVLEAFYKGDIEVLKKYCASTMVERCKAEHTAFNSQGYVFDNKILHISEVEVRETKLMGETPIIILAFQTQQVYCLRDKLGSITEGGKDSIHTVYYAWAMELVDADEAGEGAVFPLWRLKEMQQFGVTALI